MYTRFKKINSNGFTLVEIIASIAILGMVIAVLLPIFPQIMSWTQHTDDELVASNLLSQVAGDVKDINVVEFSNEQINNCIDYWQEDKFFKEYPLNGKKYHATLNVCKESDVNLYRTHIKIYSMDNDRLISESYTYISGDSYE